MIIISTTIKSYQPEFDKFFNVLRSWIYQSYDRLSLSLYFPVNQEQVRKYLAIIKNQRLLIVRERYRRFFRFKFHFAYKSQTIISLIGALGCERIYSISHIGYIISFVAGISITEKLIDKINTTSSVVMIFFFEISFYGSSETLFVFKSFNIYHFFSSLLQRKS